MRTRTTFPILFLALCIGCSQASLEPEINNTPDPDDMLELKDPPIVEPLVFPSSSGETSGTLPLVSDVLGKYAAEVVPLPPVEDLTAQMDAYIVAIEKALDDLDGSPKYAADAANVVRDASGLALVALAVGLAEADSQYKRPAGQIIAATKLLTAAKNLDEGQAAFAALKASFSGQGDGKPLAWTDKVADLTSAMKALPNLSASVKRVTDTERKLNSALNSRAQPVYSQLAALAAISQGSISNVGETEKPDAVEEWKKLCEEFRDAALKANAAARQYAKDKIDGTENYAPFNTSFRAMTASCDHCHQVFYPSAVGKSE